MLDDRPIVPGEERPPYEGTSQARQVLNDAEDDLKEWQPEAYAPTGSPKAGEAADTVAQPASVEAEEREIEGGGDSTMNPAMSETSP